MINILLSMNHIIFSLKNLLPFQIKVLIIKNPMKTSVIIPARYASTRFPGKLLALLNGKAVLWHTLQAVRGMKLADEICVLTDDNRILESVSSWGASAIMTPPHCRSGMERAASVIKQLKGDIILNVQGDEPLVDPKALDAILEAAKNTQAPILTPIYPLENQEHLFDPNLVKVVINQKGQALYFSRSTIPFLRDVAKEDWFNNHTFYGHIGIYACKRSVLENYPNIPPSPLETAENLEQLRFMDYGYSIQTFITKPSIGIDTPADLERAQLLFHGKTLCNIA